MGGVEKRGGWKTSRMTPLSQKGFWTPPLARYVSTPLRCQCSVFPVQKSTTEQTRSFFGEVQKFSGERALWYVFLPPYVLHPPISRPKSLGICDGASPKSWLRERLYNRVIYPSLLPFSCGSVLKSRDLAEALCRQKALRRVLRRCLVVGSKGKRVSQKGFLEGRLPECA